MLRLIVIGILLLVAWLSYERFRSPKLPPAPAPIAVEERVLTLPSWYGHPPAVGKTISSNPSQPAVTQPATFVCDGRTHCLQMRSCDEDKFFCETVQTSRWWNRLSPDTTDAIYDILDTIQFL